MPLHGNLEGKNTETSASNELFLPLFLVLHAVFLFAEGVEHVGWNGLHEEDVCANGAARADGGVATEDGGVRVDGDVVLHVGVALGALHNVSMLVLGEAARAKGHTVIELHVRADD